MFRRVGSKLFFFRCIRLNNWYWLYFRLFSPVEPSEIRLLVNQVADHGEGKIFLKEGDKVTLRCETKAEPEPLFSWWVPPRIYISGNGSLVSGLKWQQTQVIRSMSCLNSGTYRCNPQNFMGKQKWASKAIGVTGLFVTRGLIAVF